MTFNTRQPTQGKKKEYQVNFYSLKPDNNSFIFLFQCYLLTALAGHTSVFLWTIHGVSLEPIGFYELKEVYARTCTYL